MKIVFDATVLALSEKNRLARTGIFRVVENVLQGLALRQECEIQIFLRQPYENYTPYNRFLINSPSLKHLPLINERMIRSGVSLGEKIFVRNGGEDRDTISPDRGETHRNAYSNKIYRYSSRVVGKGLSKLFQKSYQAAISEADIFHSPHFSIPPIARNANRPCKFMTIYDLIPVKFPQFVTDQNIKNFKTALESLKETDWIFCISKSTKNDLIDIRNVDPNRVFVVYPAASHALFYPCSDQDLISEVKRKYNIPAGPYILCTNTLEPRKNTSIVIKAFSELALKYHIDDLSLVLAGAQGWKYDEIDEALREYRELMPRLIVTGYIDDADLAALYSGAMTFVFPSFYEGFGLPVLEAMQCGVPVIASNTSSLPEVIGEAGIQIEPGDQDRLSHILYELYTTPEKRREISKKGLERARMFTWDACVEQTISAYRHALAVGN